MTDLLLPRTDAGVAVQVLAVAALTVVALLAVRRQPELRVLVAGVSVFLFGAMAVRALH